MSMYLCSICDNLTDGDYNPPVEWNGGLVCMHCETEFMPEKENPSEEGLSVPTRGD